ncbi:CENP-B protein, partial [Stereum hirsutum FP-91666 SS1]|uniref:CENP-B protein n=1 Tax=Stereum hirsutum (strain FP-91666) TaxID=721885 RepID=UPI000440E965
ELIYGMDESGFPLGDFGKKKVVGRRGAKRQHKQGSGDKENVTVLVTICADGTHLRPTIIYKGKNFMQKICHSDNGWTDSELGRSWIEKDFDALTKEKAAGRTRVLIMDGHSSHYTPELLRYAKDNNIIILGYPPHCTHALQGLDVVCFACMKKAYQEAVSDFEKQMKRKFKKADFTGVFGKAFLEAFTPETIKAAFEKTGVYPFNPNAISAKQMRPSEATSLTKAYPLPNPSPVAA